MHIEVVDIKPEKNRNLFPASALVASRAARTN